MISLKTLRVRGEIINFFWKRKKKGPDGLRKIPDPLTFWMTCATFNPGPIQLNHPYAACVMNAGAPDKNGVQLLEIRIALLEKPYLEMVANLSKSQIREGFTPLKKNDFVTWVPLQHMPNQGRLMNMSEDPRADYLGYLSAQIDLGMNLETRSFSVLQEFPLS